MPPGHINAIFLEDANPLLNLEDSVKGIIEANEQGAFVFWNHPAWPAQRSNGIAKLDSLHRYLISNKLVGNANFFAAIEFVYQGPLLKLKNSKQYKNNSDFLKKN